MRALVIALLLGSVLVTSGAWVIRAVTPAAGGGTAPLASNVSYWWEFEDVGTQTAAKGAYSLTKSGSHFRSSVHKAGSYSTKIEQNGYFYNASIPRLNSGDFSVSLWYQPVALPDAAPNGSNYDGIVSQYTASTGEHWAIAGSPINNRLYGQFRIASPSGWVTCTASAAMVVGTWYHIVFVRDGSTIRFYIDGVLQQEKTLTGTLNTGSTSFEVGRYVNQNSWGANGYIDTVGVWNTVLTADNCVWLHANAPAYADLP